MSAFSARYDAALILAARAHQDQYRKGSGVPYITHVVHVSTLLLRYGYNDDVVIAGLLHDVVEDSDVSLEQIHEQFGEEVARLVGAVTKPADTPSWDDIREAVVYQIDIGGPNVAALKAADALHNIQSTVADLRREGTSVWQRFRRDANTTLSYYRALLMSIRSWIGWHPLCGELSDALDELEAVHSQLTT